MNSASKTNSTSEFLKKDGGKTKSNQIEIPSISLPKGGGAIKGIDEKFSVNAVNGTASFSIPLPISQARGVTPSLSLSYNSGGGNGVFGLGWSLGISSIKRKTDKELPKYFDSIDSDTYLLSEAEDLVPEFEKDVNGFFLQDSNHNYTIKEKDSSDNLFRIRYYRPRIEGLFARIERWINKTSGEIKWRVISKENVTTLYGWSDASRLSTPGDVNKVFEWMPEFVFDDKGNCAKYVYKKEDSIGFNQGLLHNRNRLIGGDLKYTNLYIEKVLYGNKTPYKNFNDLYPDDLDFMFQTVFDYGTLVKRDLPLLDDTVDTINNGNWDFRNDSFSEYKSGFEIRTTRLCKRILLFHYFSELPGGSALVKSLNLNYDTTIENGFTFLTSMSSYGYIKKPDGTYTSKKLPDTEFEYQKHDWNKEIRTVSSDNLVHAPVGLDEQQYQFTDLFNEGLSGILTEQANGWYYKRNLSNGKFEQAKLVTPKPSFSGLGSQLQLADLDGDGGKQLVNYSYEPKGFFEINDEEEWEPFKNFETLPTINLKDSNTRMIDLNGDGIADVLITEDNVFTWYESQGRKGFKNIHRTIKSFDEEKGPHIVFADSSQSIYLSDMNGDGLTDIVRIRNSEVCYWPNLGYGNFGAKVSMDNAPVFDFPELFNPSFLHLTDIDGSGTTDLVYLGKNKFTCWMNLSGNSFNTSPFEINPFPEINNQTKISVTDLLGNGVACIVWSSSLEKDTQTPLKYIDLMNSKKPHIMIGYKNNMGKEVSLEYTPSTKFYIDDKLAGKPWVTKLHFPVHCISKTVTIDKISGWQFISSYKYHHGYYDHAEREFRGFGMVEQTDAEHFENWAKGDAANIVDKELHQEPVVSKSWFHTGAFLNREKILNQFAHEYWYEELHRFDNSITITEFSLPDARLITGPGLPSGYIDNLSAHEWREALRSCKGMALRSEVFALDAPLDSPTNSQIELQLTPYSVAAHNCVIEVLQPKGSNKHAIFIVKESESITYSYERKTDDPRIAHNLNIKLDEYGNVLEAASVVYARAAGNSTIDSQNKTLITFIQNSFTNDIDEYADINIANSKDLYRLRMPSEIKTYELKGVTKTLSKYSINDFRNILNRSAEVGYHEINPNPLPTNPNKRLIEHVRTYYYEDNFVNVKDLHFLNSKGLVYENYQLAYTPGLLTDIFGQINSPGSKITDNLMVRGKFTHSESDTNWWVRSGRVQYTETDITYAENHFFMPVSYTDPYGALTKVKYYSVYNLIIEETEDAVNNKSKVLSFNYRTLSPQRMMDPNENITEMLSDELGLPKAMAIMGKGDEADELTGLDEFRTTSDDAHIISFFGAAKTFTYNPIDTDSKELLQHATARFVYDFDSYKNSGGKKPTVVASILREEHFKKNNNSHLQISFEYSNGLGKVAMKKIQAEPGIAKKVTINSDNSLIVSDFDTSNIVTVNDDGSSTVTRNLRWLGTGKTVLNNKGNPVKQYEPYFSVSHQYEDFKELVESGVTPVMYYDPIGRMTKTEFPDGTFSKMEFDSWKQIIYDQNDTSLQSDWYTKYITGSVKEQTAAQKSANHANTPTEHHFDTLGRPVLQIENNGKTSGGVDILYNTIAELDIEGNIRSVTDARNNVVMKYKYDMLGNMVFQESMDAGKRWMLHNIVGNPLRNWDERNHEIQFTYDILHRPLNSIVLRGDGTPLNNIFERIIYGETQPNPVLNNLRGKPFRHFDTGGMIETPKYDFKGQPISTTRKLFKNYKSVANWVNANLSINLENEKFTFTTETDALGRITKQIAPDGSVITPSYNEAGLLNGEEVIHPDLVKSKYIKDIDYNEKGQRDKIVYGNNVTTFYKYDKETFRLLSLITKRNDNSPLQELHYTYDAVGNITHIEDKAIPTQFFNTMRIEPANEYTYDPLYRLTEATGRENNAALSFDDKDNWNDTPFLKQYSQGETMGIWNYKQNYEYDEVGNISRMKQVPTGIGNSWIRDYEYETLNNRLINTKVGNETFSYSHHAQHGFIISMPHLQYIGWDFKEQVVKTSKQKVNPGNGTAETTYYQYDGQGHRIRKITENSTADGVTPSIKEERIYISGYELYKKRLITDEVLKRVSLSLMDKEHRFVMVETRNDVDDGTEKKLVRYQHHNHLGSASLELNHNADVISYEEYHPFGTTAYQAVSKSIKSAAKRYRNTGMERDEETGLEYHSARYYLPWLGRWLTADPIGIGDGVNVYAYGGNNPIISFDLTGKQTQTQTSSEEFPDDPNVGDVFEDHKGKMTWLWKADENKKWQPIGGTYTSDAATVVADSMETITKKEGNKSGWGKLLGGLATITVGVAGAIGAAGAILAEGTLLAIAVSTCAIFAPLLLIATGLVILTLGIQQLVLNNESNKMKNKELIKENKKIDAIANTAQSIDDPYKIGAITVAAIMNQQDETETFVKIADVGQSMVGTFMIPKNLEDAKDNLDNAVQLGVKGMDVINDPKPDNDSTVYKAPDFTSSFPKDDIKVTKVLPQSKKVFKYVKNLFSSKPRARYNL